MKRCVVAAVQTAAGGVDGQRIRRLLLDAPNADLYVLPELVHLPYFPLEVAPGWHERAVTLEDELVDVVAASARELGAYVVLPLYLRTGETARNSAVLIGRDGAVQAGRAAGAPDERRVSYDKVHLCDVEFYGGSFAESRYFQAGDGFVVWDTDIGRIGIAICYDRHFPESWRTLRAAGAEIVCVPTASPLATEPTFVAEMQAMCLQQGVYAVVASRAGPERLPSGRESEFIGSSCIIGPEGRVLTVAPILEPDLVVQAELDPARLEQTRAGMPLERHRRPATYLLS